MKVYKTKNFNKWCKKEGVNANDLKLSIRELTEGLSIVNLGGGLYKKRIARYGSGKSGGFRVLLAFKKDERVIFIFGFSKNDRDNIDTTEKNIYKKLADAYLKATDKQIESLCKKRELIEVTYEKL